MSEEQRLLTSSGTPWRDNPATREDIARMAGHVIMLREEMTSVGRPVMASVLDDIENALYELSELKEKETKNGQAD